MRLILATLPLLVLVGCDPRGPVVGGPCTYQSSTVTGKVTEVTENTITVTGEMRDYTFGRHELDHTPEIGERLTMKVDLITSGTCTPEIFREIVAE